MKVMLLGREVDLLIGMDAEFFLKNDKGRYIAAARVIPGLKHAPHKLDNGVCHPDGLSLEVGAPPADTPEGMVENLFTVLDEVTEKYLKPNGCTIAYACTIEHSQCEGVQPEDLEFGCGVELMANSSVEGMFRSNTATQDKFRHSGFHIHLGFTSGLEQNAFTFLDTRRLIQALDKLFVNLQTSPDRARQYGGNGAFRIKPYGIEYRMMDCRVITDAAKLKELLRCLNKLPEVFRSFK